jgi:uncharacterized protein YndB with AHSA1/START domain
LPAVEVRTFIPAPPEAVWETLADLEGQAAWMTDVVELRVTSERKEGVGTAMAVTSRVLFKKVREVATVTTWEPPHRLAVRHSGDFTGTGIFTLEPAPGGTIFVWREEIRLPFGPLGLAAFPLLRGHLVRLLAHNSDRLRDAVVARLAERVEPARKSTRTLRSRGRGAPAEAPPAFPGDAG